MWMYGFMYREGQLFMSQEWLVLHNIMQICGLWQYEWLPHMSWGWHIRMNKFLFFFPKITFTLMSVYWNSYTEIGVFICLLQTAYDNSVKLFFFAMYTEQNFRILFWYCDVKKKNYQYLFNTVIYEPWTSMYWDWSLLLW